MPSISYACTKKTAKAEQKSCSKEKSEKSHHKAVARTSPVKNVRMVTIATAIVNTALVDVVLLHLLLAY